MANATCIVEWLISLSQSSYRERDKPNTKNNNKMRQPSKKKKKRTKAKKCSQHPAKEEKTGQTTFLSSLFSFLFIRRCRRRRRVFVYFQSLSLSFLFLRRPEIFFRKEGGRTLSSTAPFANYKFYQRFHHFSSPPEQNYEAGPAMWRAWRNDSTDFVRHTFFFLLWAPCKPSCLRAFKRAMTDVRERESVLSIAAGHCVLAVMGGAGHWHKTNLHHCHHREKPVCGTPLWHFSLYALWLDGGPGDGRRRRFLPVFLFLWTIKKRGNIFFSFFLS